MEEKQEKQKLKESGVNNLYYVGILFLFRNMSDGWGTSTEERGCVEGLVVCVVHIVAGWYVGNVFARSDRNPRLLPAEIWEPFSRGTIDIVCELTRVNREISVTRTKGWLVDTEVGHGKTKDWTSCKNCTTQV